MRRDPRVVAAEQLVARGVELPDRLEVETAVRAPCADCGVSTAMEYYMIWNHLWHAAGMDPDGGRLCLGCLGTRLGRPVVTGDLTRAPINYRSRYSELWSSPRLLAILRVGEENG